MECRSLFLVDNPDENCLEILWSTHFHSLENTLHGTEEEQSNAI